ncbi:MAG: type II toxin-antitoxin system RelE/ParE family toxin [Methylotenera sp.]|nr:type II toxin-antitoxin system RelE/ParE family toxin [Methylotenera sp.]
MIINWANEARLDLREILSFIYDKNPQAADNLEYQIFEAIEQLVEHPYLYRVGAVAATREIVVHPNYLVVYRVAIDHIEILNVLHARQQYPNNT